MRYSPQIPAIGLVALALLGPLATLTPAARHAAPTKRAPQSDASSTRSRATADASGSYNVRVSVPNYDIRGLRSAAGDGSSADKAASLFAQTPEMRERVAAIGQRMEAGKARLAASVPTLNVEKSPLMDVPEIVDGKAGTKNWLTKKSSAPREQTVRSFVSKNADLYGLTQQEVQSLDTVIDSVNPDGNLQWVEYQQKIDGIPVFQGFLRAALTRNGEIVRTVGTLVPGADVPSLKRSPAMSASEAAAIAAASVNVELPADKAAPRDVFSDGRTVVLDPGPFVEEIKCEQTYFPLDKGQVTLAWSMVLWEDVNAYWVIVDAQTGVVLWRKNITAEQSQTATYNVYADGSGNPLDSPTPLSPTTAIPGANTQGTQVGRNNVTVISQLDTSGFPAPLNSAPTSNPWINDGANPVTTGNNVDAGLDVAAPNGIDVGGRPTATGRTFSFSYNPAPGSPTPGDSPTDANYRSGVVTNLFYLGNFYHDATYKLGFTEPFRNFQTSNYGRNPGGTTANAIAGNDAVRAEAQDSSGTNNANFSTGADGNAPRCQMYIFPAGTSTDRDGDLDAEVVLHEFTHGLSNRLHGNATGLNSQLAVGMGEGWSDFYARSLLSDASEDVNGLYPTGGYATYKLANTESYTDNYYYGIRRFPYAVKTSTGGASSKPFYPLTYADIERATYDTTDGAYPENPLNFSFGGAEEVHNIGEIWCMMLLEVRARLITNLGYATGNQRALQIVTDGMKLDPASPTLLQARDSIVLANSAGFAGAQEQAIWDAFATRGMGAAATSFGANTSSLIPAAGSGLLPHVSEDYSPVALALGTVTISDVLCNNNGIAEPGETLTVTVPVASKYRSITATGVSATFNGGGSVSYGTLAPQASTSKTFPYTVPMSAACGSTITIPVVISSSAGSPTTRNYVLAVGTRVAGFTEAFDGATTPGLPAGWTQTGSGWTTSTTSSNTAPNSATILPPGTASDNSLVSPTIAIPAGMTNPLLSFSQRMQFTDAQFDGGVLEVSVDGGAFNDVISPAIKGSFVQNGYVFRLQTYAGNLNPLAGRPAWSGNAGAPFFTSIVDLGPNVAGHNIKLRWRVGTDNTGADTGWAIDSVSLANASSCALSVCCMPAAIQTSPASTTICYNTSTTLSVAATGTSLSYQWYRGNSGDTSTPVGTNSSSFTTPALTAATSYWVRVTSSCGSADSATATVSIDSTPPTVTCPSNKTATADAVSDCTFGAAVSFTTPTASDACPATVACVPASGSFFPTGTTTVTCTATDSAGNTGSCSFSVTVALPNAVCLNDEQSHDSFIEIVDQTNPLYGYWRYVVFATGETLCGRANSTNYQASRSLVSYDNNYSSENPFYSMDVNANFGTKAATVNVSQKGTSRKLTLRDRNIANNPPCDPVAPPQGQGR